jgi:DNA-binding transcriptional MerR regulator
MSKKNETDEDTKKLDAVTIMKSMYLHIDEIRAYLAGKAGMETDDYPRAALIRKILGIGLEVFTKRLREEGARLPPWPPVPSEDAA